MSTESLFKIASPTGEIIEIPITVDKKTDPYSKLSDPADIKDYYSKYGYVVIRNLIPPEICDRAMEAFSKEIKTYEGHLYRQTSTGYAQKHLFTDQGYVLNSILNIQDLHDKKFSKSKKMILDVITHPNLNNSAEQVLGEQGVIVQSMYFEGNPATWAHQDTYYLDSENIGQMTAAWIALEDIQPGAGRFYVYPESHKIELDKHGGDFDIAFNHGQYKNLIIDVIQKFNLKCTAPAMQKGDVLFWNSKTIHGSLPTEQPQFSRSSMTAHIIPESVGFLQFQSRLRRLNLEKIGSFWVHCPKSQNKRMNRLILYVETHFPKLFRFIKKLAIKIITR